MWYLIVSITDLCTLTNFVMRNAHFSLLTNLKDLIVVMSESLICSPLSLFNIFIRFGSKLYRQTVGIQMGTNCAPLAADCFYFVM